MNRFAKTAAILGIVLTTSVTAFAGGRGHNMEALMELPPETQTLVLSTMKEVREENKALREEIKATREAMKEALTAPTFDAEAYNANAEKLEGLMAEKVSTFTDAIAEIAPELTQEEREVLSEIGPKKGHGPRGKHGRHSGGE